MTTTTATRDDDLTELEDHELVHEALNADSLTRRDHAFRVLYRRRNPGLLRWLQSQHGLTEEDARDTAADGWSRVHQHLHRFDPDQSQFRSWLWLIVSNLCKNVRRDRDRDPSTLVGTLEAKRPDYDRSFYDTLDASDLGPMNETLERTARPDEATEARELERAVEEALEEMKNIYSAPLRLRMEGATYEEVAATLDIKCGTAKSRLNRARTKAANHLASSGIDIEEILGG